MAERAYQQEPTRDPDSRQVASPGDRIRVSPDLLNPEIAPNKIPTKDQLLLFRNYEVDEALGFAYDKIREITGQEIPEELRMVSQADHILKKANSVPDTVHEYLQEIWKEQTGGQSLQEMVSRESGPVSALKKKVRQINTLGGRVPMPGLSIKYATQPSGEVVWQIIVNVYPAWGLFNSGRFAKLTPFTEYDGKAIEPFIITNADEDTLSTLDSATVHLIDVPYKEFRAEPLIEVEDDELLETGEIESTLDAAEDEAEREDPEVSLNAVRERERAEKIQEVYTEAFNRLPDLMVTIPLPKEGKNRFKAFDSQISMQVRQLITLFVEVAKEKNLWETLTQFNGYNVNQIQRAWQSTAFSQELYLLTYAQRFFTEHFKVDEKADLYQRQQGLNKLKVGYQDETGNKLDGRRPLKAQPLLEAHIVGMVENIPDYVLEHTKGAVEATTAKEVQRVLSAPLSGDEYRKWPIQIPSISVTRTKETLIPVEATRFQRLRGVTPEPKREVSTEKVELSDQVYDAVYHEYLEILIPDLEGNIKTLTPDTIQDTADLYQEALRGIIELPTTESFYLAFDKFATGLYKFSTSENFSNTLVRYLHLKKLRASDFQTELRRIRASCKALGEDRKTALKVALDPSKADTHLKNVLEFISTLSRDTNQKEKVSLPEDILHFPRAYRTEGDRNKNFELFASEYAFYSNLVRQRREQVDKLKPILRVKLAEKGVPAEVITRLFEGIEDSSSLFKKMTGQEVAKTMSDPKTIERIALILEGRMVGITEIASFAHQALVNIGIDEPEKAIAFPIESELLAKSVVDALLKIATNVVAEWNTDLEDGDQGYTLSSFFEGDFNTTYALREYFQQRMILTPEKLNEVAALAKQYALEKLQQQARPLKAQPARPSVNALKAAPLTEKASVQKTEKVANEKPMVTEFYDEDQIDALVETLSLMISSTQTGREEVKQALTSLIIRTPEMNKKQALMAFVDDTASLEYLSERIIESERSDDEEEETAEDLSQFTDVTPELMEIARKRFGQPVTTKNIDSLSRMVIEMREKEGLNPAVANSLASRMMGEIEEDEQLTQDKSVLLSEFPDLSGFTELNDELREIIIKRLNSLAVENPGDDLKELKDKLELEISATEIDFGVYGQVRRELKVPGYPLYETAKVIIG